MLKNLFKGKDKEPFPLQEEINPTDLIEETIEPTPEVENEGEDVIEEQSTEETFDDDSSEEFDDQGFDVDITDWDNIDNLSEDQLKEMQETLASQIANELEQVDTEEEFQERVEEFEEQIGISDDEWESIYNNPNILGYADRQEQLFVFDGTTPIEFNAATDSILDVGCGVGDYYAYLLEIKDVAEPLYTGIDYNGNMIEMAGKKYPKAKFETKDLSTEVEQYDWVVAMSAFNIPMQDDMNSYVKKSIDKMYSIAKKGIALNLIHSLSGDSEKDEGLDTFDPKELFDYVYSKYKNVRIHTNYLDRDFSIQIFK